MRRDFSGSVRQALRPMDAHAYEENRANNDDIQTKDNTSDTHTHNNTYMFSSSAPIKIMNKTTECQANEANTSANSEQCHSFVNSPFNCRKRRRTASANCRRHLQCHSIDQPQLKHSTTMARTLRVERGANVHRTHLKRLPEGRHSPTTNTSQSQPHHHIYRTDARQLDAFVDTIRDNLSTKSSRSYCTQHIFSRLFLVFVSIIVFLLQEINCDQGKGETFCAKLARSVFTLELLRLIWVFVCFAPGGASGCRTTCSCAVRHNERGNIRMDTVSIWATSSNTWRKWLLCAHTIQNAKRIAGQI